MVAYLLRSRDDGDGNNNVAIDREVQARYHTVVKVVTEMPENDCWDAAPGMVIDSTCWQLGFGDSCANWDTYLKRRAVEGESIWWEPFGTCFSEHEADLQRGETVHAFLTEATIRTINNVLYREISLLGGREAVFRDSSDEEFRAWRKQLYGVLGTALERLRAKADWVLFSDPDKDSSVKKAELQQLVHGSGGEEHEIFMDALDGVIDCQRALFNHYSPISDAYEEEQGLEGEDETGDSRSTEADRI